MVTVTNVTPFERRASDRSITSRQNEVPARRAYREREMGVGYGRSSGYASDRRYADLSAPVLMRCR